MILCNICNAELTEFDELLGGTEIDSGLRHDGMKVALNVVVRLVDHVRTSREPRRRRAKQNRTFHACKKCLKKILKDHGLRATKGTKRDA